METPSPEIGLFTQRPNRQVSQIYEQIEGECPGACQIFLIPDDGNPRVTLAESTLLWDGVDVSKLRCAYLHDFRYRNPIVPSTMENADWAVWQPGFIAVQQCSSFLYSAFSEMARRGVRLFNPLATHVASFTRQDLLESLRGAGLDVPKIICSNDIEAVNRHTSDPDSVYLWRPATGRAAWQVFREPQKRLLVKPTSPPVLIMEALQGPLLRTFIFNQEVIATLSFGLPSQLPLERLEAFVRVDYPEQHSALLKAAEHSGLNWGVIYWTLHDSKAWIYDIDVDPILGVYPEAIRAALTRALAGGLLANDFMPHEPIDFPSTPLLREQPFLRRMLSILFELEARKYLPIGKS